MIHVHTTHIDYNDWMNKLVLGLGLENELECSVNLVTKTRVHIEFYGHIDKISRRMIWNNIALAYAGTCQAHIKVYRCSENRWTRKWHSAHLTQRHKKTHFISGNVVQIGEFWPLLGHTCIASMCCYQNVIKMSSARNFRAIYFWTRALGSEAPVTKCSSFRLLVPPLE